MKDKRSFSLKRSFEQPVWIQQITRNWSLNNAKKFSTYAYAVGVFIILWIFPFQFFGIIPLNWRLFGDGFLAWSVGLAFSDYRPDGKSFPVYLWDFSKTYFIYFRKKGYWVKGVHHREVEED
ncbi:MAG: TcpE family conjugal transfer membrane protein [Lactococcus lactis]